MILRTHHLPMRSQGGLGGPPKPHTQRGEAPHSKTLGLVHRPHEPTQKPRGGHHRTNSAHGSALPSAHDSHADDRDVHGECARNSIKVPTKFIVKVGQRPRAVPGSLQGPPGDPPTPLPGRRQALPDYASDTVYNGLYIMPVRVNIIMSIF